MGSARRPLCWPAHKGVSSSLEWNIALFNPGPSCVSHTFAHRATVVLGTGAVDEAWKRATAVPFVPAGRARRQRVPGDGTSPLSIGSGRDPPNRRILLTYTVFGRKLSTSRSTLPVTPAVKRKRRHDSRQTTFAFRPAGRGGARPGAGRRRIRRSRVPHRARERVPRDCPLLVTLRVEDDVPALRRARFVRAFRESLEKAAERPGFRVVHYCILDNHAHFLVEADGNESLANGMKSLGARFARCVNRVFGHGGRVLATRFHHVVKRTPTEVRNALAYVLLNARKHYRERRRRKPPVVLDGASSGLWFDGWKGRSPPPFGRYADAHRRCEVAAARTWLLETGWRRIGLIDPAEVPGMRTRRRRGAATTGCSPRAENPRSTTT